MSKIKTILKSIMIISGAAYAAFLGFKLFKHFSKNESFFANIQSLLNYSLYKSGTINFTIEKILLLVLFVFISIWASKFLIKQLLHRILEKTSLDRGAKAAIENLSGYILNLTFILLALSFANVPLAAFTFLGGAVAIGAGFGSQNLINNFISGIILQIEKPIKVGDYITIESISGVIDEIGMRSTKIKLTNNTFTVIPNSLLLEKNVNNWNFKNDLYRCKITVEFSFTNKETECLELLHDVMAEFKGQYLEFPAYIIYLSAFTNNGNQFDLLFWVDLAPGFDRGKLESDIRLQILKKSREKKIELSTNEMRLSRKT